MNMSAKRKDIIINNGNVSSGDFILEELITPASSLSFPAVSSVLSVELSTRNRLTTRKLFHYMEWFSVWNMIISLKLQLCLHWWQLQWSHIHMFQVNRIMWSRFKNSYETMIFTTIIICHLWIFSETFEIRFWSSLVRGFSERNISYIIYIQLVIMSTCFRFLVIIQCFVCGKSCRSNFLVLLTIVLSW